LEKGLAGGGCGSRRVWKEKVVVGRMEWEEGVVGVAGGGLGACSCT
jgi:hypothetical protein